MKSHYNFVTKVSLLPFCSPLEREIGRGKTLGTRLIWKNSYIGHLYLSIKKGISQCYLEKVWLLLVALHTKTFFFSFFPFSSEIWVHPKPSKTKIRSHGYCLGWISGTSEAGTCGQRNAARFCNHIHNRQRRSSARAQLVSKQREDEVRQTVQRRFEDSLTLNGPYHAGPHFTELRNS